MKAIRIHTPGGPEALTLDEVPEPTPGAGQAVVKLAAAGLPREIRFYDLRHSCASFLVAQGVHPRQIMEVLGHSQISER